VSCWPVEVVWDCAAERHEAEIHTSSISTATAGVAGDAMSSNSATGAGTRGEAGRS
jgi:hypothetical protein